MTACLAVPMRRIVHVVLGGWCSIDGRPLRPQQAELFFCHTLRVLTSAGKIDRGATSSGKLVGAAAAQKRTMLRQPADRLLRPESKMTI